MIPVLNKFRIFSGAHTPAQRVVPPSGFTAQLTVFSAAAMAFLAVFALALSLATGRLADRWASALAHSATVRITAPKGQLADQTRAAEKVLRTTPGVARVRVLSLDDQKKLLAPWFGPDLPVQSLPLPQLIEVIGAASGYDAEGLRLRLSAEAPGAVLDDHTRWRKPLVSAARRLRTLGLLSIFLIALTTVAMITLAANAALAANAQVIGVLRLVGALDSFIARAFVRRFTLRAFGGALLGTVAGMAAIAFLPSAAQSVAQSAAQSAAPATNSFLTGLGFHGAGWLWPLIIPPLAGLVAFWATRAAALRRLKEQT